MKTKTFREMCISSYLVVLSCLEDKNNVIHFMQKQ